MGAMDRRTLLRLGLAGLVWTGAAAGRWWGVSAWAVAVLLVALGSTLAFPAHRSMILLALLLTFSGAYSGAASMRRERAILDYRAVSGRADMVVRLLSDPREGDYGWWVLAVADPPRPGRPAKVPLLVSLSERPPAQARQKMTIRGLMISRSGRAGGDPYSGVLRADSARLVPGSAPWWMKVGNVVRTRALRSLSGRGGDRGLLAGFLVGDTTDISKPDMEAMRRSGLSHLVAVSGSNVALFLMLVLMAAGPLAAGPRRRAVVGLLAVAVFVVATRWEPSVVRASVMAALVLLGRIGGWALDAFTSLAATVVLLVVVSGELSTDVGFTLSVLATLGVLVGARVKLGTIPRWLGSTLAATVGAQLAVAPVLIAVFGALPLLAPVTNLLAAPLVAASTTVATVGVGLGVEPLIRLAALGAQAVLTIARLGAGWPQLGWVGFGLVAALGLATTRRRTRPWMVVVAALVGTLTLLGGSHQVPRPGAVVFDVGQGDSILVVASDGSTLLVDGGPDAALLERKLSEYGVSRVDLLVLTHVHADHATGLEAVVGRRPVGEFWFPTPPHSTPASEHLAKIARRAGLELGMAPVGAARRLGDLRVEVLGPVRQYASPNDQSVVLLVHRDGGPRLLLTGDAESYAQADMGQVRAEILKVPHQGAATSDLGWLASVGAKLAVIPVGPNDYGHPSAEVIATLESHGARVLRTDRDGDVVVSLR